MKSNTLLHLLTLGGIVYTIGYVWLLVAVLQGEVGGPASLAFLLMATGILIAFVFGILLAKLQAELIGEL